MGVFRLLLAVCSPLLIANLLPQHNNVKAIDIISAVSDTGSSPDVSTSLSDVSGSPPDVTGSGADLGNSMEVGDVLNRTDIIARNTVLISVFGDRVSLQDMMVIVCDRLQGEVPVCDQVPTFRDYMESNRATFSPPRAVRKKRFSGFSSNFNNNNLNTNSWFGPGFSSGFNNFNDPWQNTNSFGPNSFSSGYNSNNNPGNSFSSGYNSNNPSNSFPSGYGHINTNSNAYICPSQQDQSTVYQLNPDSTGYPAVDIANELNANILLRDCLAREIVLATDPPTVIVDDFRLTANVTCPFTQLRLWQYQSQAAVSTCWILQNFQENILYRVCSERFCRNCKNKQTGYNSYQDNQNQKFCVADYRTVSTWSYCPQLTTGQRIIRDRIIVPYACSCQSIRCEQIPSWRK